MIESLFLIEWAKGKNNPSIHDISSLDSKKIPKKNGKAQENTTGQPKIKFSYPREAPKITTTVLNQILTSHNAEMETINDLCNHLEEEYEKALLENKVLKKRTKSKKSSKKSTIAQKECDNATSNMLSSRSEFDSSILNYPNNEDEIDWDQVIFGEQVKKENNAQNSHLNSLLNTQPSYTSLINAITKDFQVLVVENYVLYSCFIPQNGILCLVFDKDEDNPYDHRNDFEESLNVFVFPKILSFMKSVNSELTTAIISIFLDIRGSYLISQEETGYHAEDVIIEEATQPKQRIAKLFLYGIDNAGKSSFMRYLKTDGKFDHNYFPPTKKFVIHKIELEQNVKLIFWEMPGQQSFRRVWLRGVQDSNLLMFMLDAADKERYMEAKGAFWSIITQPEVRDVPVLFIVNKIDLLDNEMELQNIAQVFSLPDLKGRTWDIKFTSCVNKKGIKDVLNWIAQSVKNNTIGDCQNNCE